MKSFIMARTETTLRHYLVHADNREQAYVKVAVGDHETVS